MANHYEYDDRRLRPPPGPPEGQRYYLYDNELRRPPPPPMPYFHYRHPGPPPPYHQFPDQRIPRHPDIKPSYYNSSHSQYDSRPHDFRFDDRRGEMSYRNDDRNYDDSYRYRNKRQRSRSKNSHSHSGDEQRKKRSRSKSRSRGRESREPEDSKSEEVDELDLSMDLHPLTYYVNNKPRLLEESMQLVTGKRLEAMIPPILKEMKPKDLRKSLLTELEKLDKATVLNILDGKLVSTSKKAAKKKSEKVAEVVASVIPPKKLKRKLKKSLNAEKASKKLKELKKKKELETSEDSATDDEPAPSKKPKKKKKKAKKKAKEVVAPLDQPVTGRTLMELLELEYRAKAIKALLKTQDVDPTKIDEALALDIESSPSKKEIKNDAIDEAIASVILESPSLQPEVQIKGTADTELRNTPSAKPVEIVTPEAEVIISDKNQRQSPADNNNLSQQNVTDISKPDNDSPSIMLSVDPKETEDEENEVNEPDEEEEPEEGELGGVNSESEASDQVEDISEISEDHLIRCQGEKSDSERELEESDHEEVQYNSDPCSPDVENAPSPFIFTEQEQNEEEEGEVHDNRSVSEGSDKLSENEFPMILEIENKNKDKVKDSKEVEEKQPQELNTYEDIDSSDNERGDSEKEEEKQELVEFDEIELQNENGEKVHEESEDDSDGEASKSVDKNKNADDEEDTPLTWYHRWYNSKKVQGVVKANRVIGKLRTKLRREKAIADQEIKSKKAAEGLPLKDESDAINVPIIGSIEEYESLFGKKVPPPDYTKSIAKVEVLPSSASASQLPHQEPNAEEDEEEEEAGDKDLWGDILGSTDST